MREKDRIGLEPASDPKQRFHRGRLGQVLERFLNRLPADERVDYSLLELDQLWRKAALLEPAIGLKLFALFTPQDWHVLAYLCLYSPDVEASMRYWARYAPLAPDTDNVRLIDDENGFGVQLRVDAPSDLCRYITEHYGVMSIALLRRGTGQDIRPVRAQFTHSRPAYHRQYGPWFGERIEFDCATSRFYFDPPSLALAMQTRHHGMLELLTQELDRRIAVHRSHTGWAAKVAEGARSALSSGHPPNLGALAQALHQTPRTLRRRLEAQGTTFRRVLDQVRAELEAHLQLQGASGDEIASQLGYADPAAYAHARSRWRSGA